MKTRAAKSWSITINTLVLLLSLPGIYTTGYSQESAGTVTDIDGNVYQTVKIGEQIWIAENLKTTKFNDGTQIPNVIDNTQWKNLTTGAYCWYNNDATNKNPYGALYNWYAVETGKLCPKGWHVSSNKEWDTLSSYLGGGYEAGGKLKATDTTYWRVTNKGATNESGFTALPSGCRFGDSGACLLLNVECFWWTSTTTYSDNKGNPYMRAIFSDQILLKSSNAFSKETGYPVRCIKD